ncbi:hypothetical protein ABPG72_021290 [Tetrahymena utriculariae]
MGSQMVESIGLIMEKCNEETKVNLINKNCQFNTERRFELDQQLIKIKNEKDFTFNDVCIYNQLQDEDVISSLNLQNKFPYYLSTLCQNLRNRVINFDWNYLIDNNLVLKKQNSFFSKFKTFSLSSISIILSIQR